MNLVDRANVLLNPSVFADANPVPMRLGFAQTLPELGDMMVLRMCLKANGGELTIPEQLATLSNFIRDCQNHHDALFPKHAFTYVTVRSGKVSTTTDDLWHVDGFSMRTPHLPEQNYIVSRGGDPTEWLSQKFPLPEDFDPQRHNIHHYFQDRAEDENIQSLLPNHVYVIDPYNVHRRPKLRAEVVNDHRTFVRVSFVPIEIEDDRNTPNPLLPRPKFNRGDVRDTLVRYV